MKDDGETRHELAQADRHIKEAQARIAEQRKRVADLSAGGRNAQEAETLLARLMESLETMVQHRETILREVEGKG
jgi:Fe2+ or Zn2+ uptake regulation protein